MSEDQQADGNVDIPEAGAADIDHADRPRKSWRPSPAVKVLIFGALGLATIAAAALYTSTSITTPSSNLRSAPDLDTTPGGEVQEMNPRFQQLIRDANDRRSQDALERQQTFIPSPEGIAETVEREDITAPLTPEAEEPQTDETPVETQQDPQPPVRTVIETRPAPPAQPARQQQVQTEENPFTSAMIAQMDAVSRASEKTGAMMVSTLATDSGQDMTGTDIQAQQEALATSGAAPAASGAASGGADGVQVIPAGEILYGETLTASNSDLPGPVSVEITTGDFKGARLIGAFSTTERSDRMVVEFSTMSFADGETVSISAFAVDGMTAETSVASDVDRRYLQRYVPLLASAFIASYAESQSRTDQQAVAVGDSVTTVSEAPDATDSLFAGLSAASNAISQDLAQNAPRGPLVTLRAGWPIGVMFAEPVARAR